MTKPLSENRRLRLTDIPELARSVGLHGRLGQAEVGGSGCFSVIVALVASGG